MSVETILRTDIIPIETNKRDSQVIGSANEPPSLLSSKSDGLATRLATFLRDASAKPFKLGVHDCGLMLADWCLAERGIDPAASIREKYSSVDEAQQFVGVGSLPQVFGRMLRASGIHLTTSPVYGDIAMIKIGDAPVRGAIVTNGYVILSEGVGISRIEINHARLVAAWSINA
jgi:hypothetical protein